MTSDEHYRFLSDMEARGEISGETAETGRRVWRDALALSGGSLPLPSACVGPERELFYGWDDGEHHLDIEIVPHACVELFYVNRRTKETWDADYAFTEPMPATMAEKLRLFVPSEKEEKAT